MDHDSISSGHTKIQDLTTLHLQHVLPTGFMKVRYYGFPNPNCKVTLDLIKNMIETINGFDSDSPKAALKLRRPITCPSCGGLLKLCSLTPPARILAWSG